MYFNKKHCSHRKTRILVCGAAIVCSIALSNFRALANSIIFTYDYAGLQAQFVDVSSGEVELTLTASSATETINALYFNLNPSLSPSSLVFNPPSSAIGDFANPTIEAGANAFKVDGGGKYDIMFGFQNDTLAQGMAVFFITGISGLTAEDFNYFSTECAGGSGPTESSALVSTSTGSALIILDNVETIPDGFATATLLGIGMLSIEWMRKHRGRLKITST